MSKPASNVVNLAAPLSSGTGTGLLKEAQLLQWLGQNTITFNRDFVDLTGNVLSALWLGFVLDRIPAFVREGRASAEGGTYTFVMTSQECEEATGITRAQQATCRRQLAEAGLLTESGRRGKAVVYTLHMDRLSARLAEMAQPLAQALQASHDSSQERSPVSRISGGARGTR